MSVFDAHCTTLEDGNNLLLAVLCANAEHESKNKYASPTNYFQQALMGMRRLGFSYGRTIISSLASGDQSSALVLLRSVTEMHIRLTDLVTEVESAEYKSAAMRKLYHQKSLGTLKLGKRHLGLEMTKDRKRILSTVLEQIAHVDGYLKKQVKPKRRHSPDVKAMASNLDLDVQYDYIYRISSSYSHVDGFAVNHVQASRGGLAYEICVCAAIMLLALLQCIVHHFQFDGRDEFIKLVASPENILSWFESMNKV